MKPKNIFLIRHGESEANENPTLLRYKPDWQAVLSPKGIIQAKDAGRKLLLQTGDVPVRIYASPWYRTRQTAEEIRNNYSSVVYREDPRLREQEWGNYHLNINDDFISERERFGKFYYRFANGESGADIYDRISTFLESLWRDFENPDYPANVIIVTHGMTLRVFLMRWFHFDIEYFDRMSNPKNCEIIRLSLDENIDRYKLATQLRMHSKVQYDEF